MDSKRRSKKSLAQDIVIVISLLLAASMARQFICLSYAGNVGAENRNKFSLDDIKTTLTWWGQDKIDKQPDIHFTVVKLFEERLKQYKEGLEGLRTNLTYQFVFILLTFLTIVSKTGKIKIPVADIEVENTAAISLVMCASLAFLWLSFGFTSNQIISDRFRLHSLGAELDGRPDLHSGLPGAETGSVQRLLADGGIFDAWFTVFTPTPWKASDRPGGYCIMGFAALFLGLSNGCLLGLAWRAYTVSANSWSLSCFFIFSLFLLITHAGFFGLTGVEYGNHNENWLQALSLVTSTVVLTLIHRELLKASDSTPQDSCWAL